MSMKLIAQIESFGEAGYLAWIDSIKGMAVQADTPEKAVKELLISLKAKLSFDLGIKFDDIEAVEEREIKPEEIVTIAGKTQKEINFSFA